MPEGGPKLKLQEYVERRTSPVLRRCRQRVNCQRYEAKFDRAADDLSRWQNEPRFRGESRTTAPIPSSRKFLSRMGPGLPGGETDLKLHWSSHLQVAQ